MKRFVRWITRPVDNPWLALIAAAIAAAIVILLLIVFGDNLAGLFGG